MSEKVDIILSSSFITEDDCTFLNYKVNNENVAFVYINTNNLNSSYVIMLIIDISINIISNTIYEAIKYAFRQLLLLIHKKEEVVNKNITIKTSCNGKTFSFSCNFPITQEQEEKMLNIFMDKIINS